MKCCAWKIWSIYCAISFVFSLTSELTLFKTIYISAEIFSRLHWQLSQNAWQMCSELERRYAESAIFGGGLLALMMSINCVAVIVRSVDVSFTTDTLTIGNGTYRCPNVLKRTAHGSTFELSHYKYLIWKLAVRTNFDLNLLSLVKSIVAFEFSDWRATTPMNKWKSILKLLP